MNQATAKGVGIAAEKEVKPPAPLPAFGSDGNARAASKAKAGSSRSASPAGFQAVERGSAANSLEPDG